MQKLFISLVSILLVIIVSGCTHTFIQEENEQVPEFTEKIDQNQTEETEYTQIPPPSFATIEDASILVGAWTVVEGGDYDEINLSADGTFSTFLYQKPFESGTWKLASEGLILDFDNLSDKTYAYVDAEEGLIILESKDYTDRQVWEPLN